MTYTSSSLKSMSGKELMTHSERDDMFQRIAEQKGLQFAKSGIAIKDPTLDSSDNVNNCFEIRSISGESKGKRIVIRDIIDQYGAKRVPFDWKHLEYDDLPKIEDNRIFVVSCFGLYTIFSVDDTPVDTPSATLFWIPLGIPAAILASEKQILHFIETFAVIAE